MQLSQSFFWSLACAVLVVNAQTNLTLSEVETAFINAKIPADAHITFSPSIFLEVVFPHGSNSTALQTPGSTLSIAEVAPAPSFALSGNNLTSEYGFVILAFDLDAPSPDLPLVSPYRHFLGGGFTVTPNNTVSSQTWVAVASSTPATTDWESPSPLSVALHRYVFLVYDQSAEFATQTLVDSSTSRILWNVSEFTKEVGLGNPIGGTFMLVGLLSS